MRILVFLFTILFFSCENNLVKEEVLVFEDSCWNYNDVLTFNYLNDDVEGQYSLLFMIQHSDTFYYENIYTEIKTTLLKDSTITQVLSLELTDKLDQWVGKSKRGICTTELVLQEQFQFQYQGNYSIDIQQFSRMDDLCGIKQIAIELSRVD